MIKNYFNLNNGLNLQKTIALFFVFFIFSQAADAQCATPIMGCSNTDLSNFGAASNSNAATIEYDNFVSSWHTTVVRTSDGSLQTWGETISSTGTNQLSPITINKANFPALSAGAVPLKAALGSSSSDNVQGILLATDGLYAWSKVGAVLDASLTSSAVFQKLTIGGNANGLPSGVAPGDVKMMFGTFKTLAITTCSGDVWVISQTAAVRANGASGNSTTWYRVRTSENNNPFLTDVVACRGNNDALMALKSDGTVFIWGVNVFLGNNSAAANQNYASAMTLPAGITPKMIGSTGTGTLQSHYILATNGSLYALGNNSNRQLGDWTSATERLAWIQPRYTSASGPFMNDIKWFSPQEHDARYAAINVLTNANKIYAFGNSNGSLLGVGSATSNNPTIPGGLGASDNILAIETGGHTSMLVKSCEAKFGYVGHRISGSMGDGTNNTTNETSYTFATADVQICGAESNPAIQPISTGGGPDSKYCVDDPVILNPTPAGGTLSIVSGPGTLAGNTLSFTGEGTVSVKYSVTTSCGGTSVTTRNFDAALCPADLEITKTADNLSPSVGNNVVFTITAKNKGPYKATGIAVSDVLPSGYTFVSAVPSIGTWLAPNWTVGSLANGASASLTITATVNSTGSYGNTASISGNNPDGTNGNNSATATPLVQSNLSVTKSVNNTSPNVGSTVTFTITASNAGPSAATGVKVTDVLPSGYTFVSASPSVGTWSEPDWTINNLANGASATLTMQATVNASGYYANTASISGEQNDPTGGDNSETVTPVVKHFPIAVKDVYTVAEDNAIALTPLANDTDADGDALSIASINGTALTGGVQTIAVPNGTVNISASGAITFTPAANFNSTTPISFPYVITDGSLTSTANIEITVTAVNDGPVAVKDVYTVAEDNTIPLTPLANDTDADGDALSIASINGTALTGGVQTIAVPNGTVNISASGAITFTPAANFNSTTPISFPYVITDGSLTSTANIEITVTAVNDGPVAVKDVYTVAEDNTIPLTPLANDTDADGDALSIASINGTALTGGVQTIAVPNGTVNISASGAITFTPAANFNSTTPISFPYVITDGSLTSTANIEITVTAVNDGPVAVKDVYTVAEDNTIPLTPLANDTDADGDALSIASINGTALTGGVQTIAVPNGTVNISASGAITFTPAANFNSTTPISFPYVITDGSLTSTANIEITVTAVNDGPVAVKDVYTVAEDNTIPLTPLANDTDADGDALSIASINGTALTGGVQTIAVPNGTVNISASGAITFTPAANFNSTTPISFPYVITDGSLTSTANIEITVTAVNDAPIANDDTNNAIASTAGAVAINALTGSDIDGTIASYTILSLPADGVLTLAGSPITVNQILTPAEAAMVFYTPSGTFSGNVTFDFTVTDDLGLKALLPGTITIPVGNNAPVAKDDTNTTIPSSAGATAIKALSATDTDGTIANYTVLSLPSNGILALNGTPVAVGQILTPAEAGMLTYDPSGSFSGNDSFIFTATDNNGAVDATPAIITIPVGKRIIVAVKDEAGPITGINETVKVTNVLDNDRLDSNPLTPADVDLKVLTPDPAQRLTLKADGTVEVAPNAPEGTYTLTYEICEKANSGNCASASVTVTVVAPTMTIKAESYCFNNAAYVSYSVKADNFTPSGLLTINWIDSSNRVVATQTGMPLKGNVLWPGTAVDGNNLPTDWPGWILANGQWIEGNDGFELTRPAVTMQFSLNPTQSVTVNYPSATSGCTAKPHFGINAGNDDDFTTADGINGSLEAINVLKNDKLNGLPVNPVDVILTADKFPQGITLNQDGTIDVAPGTKGGDYILTYQICEKANPGNCSSATVRIFVEKPSVSLVMKVKLNDENENGNVEAGETLTYTFTVTNTGNATLNNVLISDILPGITITGGPISLGVGQSDSLTFTGTYTLTQADINAGHLSNQATVSGSTQSGIVATDQSDSENINGDNPTVIELNGCSIKIYNAVSLNGDGMNERFYIKGIECYPDNTIQIYNRWGVLVFDRDHYNNNDIVFKGYSEGRTTVKGSEGLPEGTYYYILKYKDSASKPKQEAGYLYLAK